MPGRGPGISLSEFRRRVGDRMDGRIPGTSLGVSGHDRGEHRVNGSVLLEQDNCLHHGAVPGARRVRHRRAMLCTIAQRKSARAVAGTMSGRPDPVLRARPCSCARDLSGAGDAIRHARELAGTGVAGNADPSHAHDAMLHPGDLTGEHESGVQTLSRAHDPSGVRDIPPIPLNPGESRFKIISYSCPAGVLRDAQGARGKCTGDSDSASIALPFRGAAPGGVTRRARDARP